MAVNIARPTTGLGSGLYHTTGDVVISATGTQFAIKAFQIDVSFNVPTVEVTGSGDSAATFITGKVASGTFKITGAMVVDAAMGIANLISQDTATGGNGAQNLTPTAQLTVNFGGHANNNVSGEPVYIDSIQIQHQIRQGAIVGVVMSGRMSGVAVP